MEMFKSAVDKGNIIKVNIGIDVDEESNSVSGAVELDIENQAQFVELINTIFDDGVTQVIVDMINISYIDSSGLWALFEGHKKATQKNGKLVLLNPTKDVRRVLDITKMSSKMQIFEEESEAVNYLNAN